MQEAVAGDAARSTGRVVSSPVAADGVVVGVAFIGIEDSELGVIEDVEDFSAEFQSALASHFHLAEDRRVKVEASRVIQGVASGIALGQTARGNKAARTFQQRPDGAVFIASHIAAKSVRLVR